MYTLDAVVIELNFYVPKDIIFFHAILGAIFTKSRVINKS